MQGFGILFGTIVTIIVSSAFRHAFPAPPFYIDAAASIGPEADYVWRIIVMFGTIPAALTYYWRMKMPETARYTALIAGNTKQATSDMSKVLNKEISEEAGQGERATGDTWGLFSRQFMKRHGVHLLATTSTWFLLDVAFYSQNLFQKDIFTKIGWIPPAKTMNALEELPYRPCPSAHRALRHGNHTGFVVLYGLTFFFANFGPNSTTFIVPAEIFPARLRSTCHGISAATGKAGAIIGAFGFLYASQDQKKPETGYSRGIGMRNALFVLAGTNFLGLLFSLLVPESKGKSLEELSKENVGDDGIDA
ncbi:hypothetical protein ZWY2020_035065 [Hordeum vulgare]|nr:hypothetical protein ZWY2020_035065 [Hordeum vulgare]